MMFGILSNDTSAADDADVIITAHIVGLCVRVLSAGNPLRFDTQATYTGMPETLRAEADADAREMAKVVASLNALLHLVHPGLRPLEQGVSPSYDTRTKLVYGVPGGEQTDFFHRCVEPPFTEISAELHQEALNDPTLGYRGRGAYTGFVVSPEGAPMITSTYCTIIPDDPVYGTRWRPESLEKRGREANQRTWGMIGTNETQKQLTEQGMGFIPPALDDAIRAWDPRRQLWTATDPREDILGYTHGMIQAIVKCFIRKGGSLPYEIAVGGQTTKLASCFPCTTFMYANGFPPSSIHLDKAESWVPMYRTHFAPEIRDSIPVRELDATNDRWHAYAAECLGAGVEALMRGRERVRSNHHRSLQELVRFLEREHERTTAANLMLDAVTVSEKERTRVARTLE